MFIANLDPLAFGMAGIALLLSLISLLIIIFYLRKLVLSAMRMADAFMAVLDAHGYFTDGDDEGDEDSTVDTDPPGDPGATAPLPDLDGASASFSEEDDDADIEEEANLALIFHRITREEDLALV